MRVRVPDFCVLAEEAPNEQVIQSRQSSCMETLADRAETGVPMCWVIDPIGRRGWAATHKVLTEATDGILRVGDIEMPLSEVLE
jgi:hypothetical protein